MKTAVGAWFFRFLRDHIFRWSSERFRADYHFTIFTADGGIYRNLKCWKIIILNFRTIKKRIYAYIYVKYFSTSPYRLMTSCQSSGSAFCHSGLLDPRDDPSIISIIIDPLNKGRNWCSNFELNNTSCNWKSYQLKFLIKS